MTKLLIGLGVLIVIGALFGALSALRIRLFQEETAPATEQPEVEKEPLRAVVHCTGGGASFTKYRYQGVVDCLAAAQLPGGGPLLCDYGCLGMGTCVQVCPVGAIRIREGVAVIDREWCTACGECVDACPRHIISLEPFRPKKHILIPCASGAGGTGTAELCVDGCIGCGICVGACPKAAITETDGVIRIDHGVCDSCGLCVQKCPRNLIRAEVVAEPPKPEPPKPPKPPKEKKPKAPKKPRESKRTKEIKKPPEPKRLRRDQPSKPTALQESPKSELSEKPLAAEAPASGEREVGVEPKTPSRPGQVASAMEEGAKTSVEAFKAFEQVVAAAGEVLGEKEVEVSGEKAVAAADSGSKTE